VQDYEQNDAGLFLQIQFCHGDWFQIGAASGQHFSMARD
jgi:hypothetical protein